MTPNPVHHDRALWPVHETPMSPAEHKGCSPRAPLSPRKWCRPNVQLVRMHRETVVHMASDLRRAPRALKGNAASARRRPCPTRGA
jgi:hypothetical protein